MLFRDIQEIFKGAMGKKEKDFPRNFNHQIVPEGIKKRKLSFELKHYLLSIYDKKLNLGDSSLY